MADSVSIDVWIKEEIARQRAALYETGPQWDSTTQIRFERLETELKLDQLEALDEEYYDFMSQCALLAGENMQDARLQILEQEVDELQNPPFDLAETLLQGALIMVGELIIVSSAYYAVPALAALLFGGKLRSLRKELTERAEFSQIVAEVGGDIQRRLAADRNKARNLLKQMRELGPDGYGSNLDLQKEREAVIRSISGLKEELRIAEAARTNSEELAERVASAFRNTKLVVEEVPAAIAGRIAETTGESFAGLSKRMWSQSGGSPFPAFETSGLVGEFLSALAQARFANRETLREQRFQVRFLQDEHWEDSTFPFTIRALAKASDFKGKSPSTFSVEERGVVIQAFEVLLWRYWFSYNNLLQVVEFTDEETYRTLDVGYWGDGRLVKSYTEPERFDGPGLISGDYYSGAVRLNEGQAKYLFNKFARNYFIRNPRSSPIGRDFDVKRYDELWEIPKRNFLGWSNNDHATRLDEVKFLVVVYFISAGMLEPEKQDAAAKQIRDAIRETLRLEPSENPLQKMLDGMPEFSQPPEVPNLSQTDASDISALASTLASVGGLEQKWLTGDAQAQLESAVIDLDMKIGLYEVRSVSDAELSAGSEVDALREIEEKQSQVASRYSAFLELAADDRELTSTVEEQFGERIRKLVDWAPGTAWQWYGPDGDGAPPVS